jgi:hypothetical protein
MDSHLTLFQGLAVFRICAGGVELNLVASAP